MEHLETKGGGLAAKVASAKPIALQGGMLTIAFSPSDPAAKMLADICDQPHTKERLQTAFSEILCTPIGLKVTLQQTDDTAAPAAYKPKGARTSQKEMNDILNDPSIKTLILGMNAKVTGVENDSPLPEEPEKGV
jgi:hypothetical protein